jgi:hypothetical protein
MHSIDHFAVSKPIHDRVILVFIIWLNLFPCLDLRLLCLAEFS